VPALLLVIIYANNGLYPAVGLSAVEEVRRLSLSTGLLFLIVIYLHFSPQYNRRLLPPGLRACLGSRHHNGPAGQESRPAFMYQVYNWWVSGCHRRIPDRRVIEVAEFFVRYPIKGIVPQAVFVEEENQFKRDPHFSGSLFQRISTFCQTVLGIKTVLVVVPNWNWISDNIDKYRYTFETSGPDSPSRRIVFPFRIRKTLDFNQVIGFPGMP